jgi:hypothetical protein
MSHEKFQSCIDECNSCAVECRHCAVSCLGEKDVEMLTRCIKLNYDCSSICLLAIELMAGGSEFAKKFCVLCADVCDECAAECEKHSHMEHCKKCAEACRKCAIACREMSLEKVN